MVQLRTPIKPSDKFDDGSFDLLPSGFYIAHIKKEKDQQFKSKLGHMVVFTWEITQGQFAKRLIWQNVIYDYQTKPKVEGIGKAMLQKIALAVGITTDFDSTADFQFIEVVIKLGKEDGENGYSDKNKVVEVFARDRVEFNSEFEAETSQEPIVRTTVQEDYQGPGVLDFDDSEVPF